MIINKYKIGVEIKRGSFGCVLRGNYLKTGEPVAVKIEYGGIATLKHEVKIINYLSTSGVKQIPSIYWYGIHENNPCLIITLYECSLFDYMKDRKITIEKMNMLMLKTLDIIEHIHRFFVLHRDIKPANFMIKGGDVFLIDFGLSAFFINGNGEHYPNKQNTTIIGTPTFVSINIHMGHQYSRRDDLISLGYMYVYMILGGAPWVPTNNPTNNPTNKSFVDIDHPINITIKDNKSYDVFSKYIHEYPLMQLSGSKTQTQNTRTHEDTLMQCINQYILYTYSLEYFDIPKYTPLKQIFMTNSQVIFVKQFQSSSNSLLIENTPN